MRKETLAAGLGDQALNPGSKSPLTVMTPSLAHTAACIPSHAQQGFLGRKSQRVRREGRSEEHFSGGGQSGHAMDAPEKRRLGEEVSGKKRRWYLK